MKTRWFMHYNKPESRRKGHAVMTLHYKDVCHLVRNVVVNTPCESHERTNQPRCVIRGWATDVVINKDGVATIN
jgi:dihydroneopterin aldolase